MKNQKLQKEKEKFELLEKGFELEKKLFEIAKEKNKIDLQIESDKIKNEMEQLKINKINSLLNLLSDVTINEEKSIIGSEPFFALTIQEEQRPMITLKLMELVKNL